MTDRLFIDATDVLIATHIRKARKLQVINGHTFAEFVADEESLIGPARRQFLNIADPKAHRGLESSTHE